MRIDFFSAVLLVSKNAPRLASFYRDVLGVPLEDEQHGDEPLHYGCELGDLHFAIHPAKEGEEPGAGGVKLAFEVFDLDAYAAQLLERDVQLVEPVRAVGSFMRIASIRDPDGNAVEFTELGEGWYRHLEARREKGHDMVARYRGLVRSTDRV